LKHAAKQSRIRQHLDRDVRPRPQHAAEQYDVQPIALRTPPHKVHQRDALQNETPRVEVLQSEHRYQPVRLKQNGVSAPYRQTEHRFDVTSNFSRTPSPTDRDFDRSDPAFSCAWVVCAGSRREKSLFASNL